MDGPEAVGAGVAAADDNDALAAGIDGRGLEHPLEDEVGGLEVVHGEVHAAKLTAGHLEVAWACRAGRQHHGVELVAQAPTR